MRRLMPIMIAMSLCAAAQTKVDLKAQSKNVDFTTASATKPLKTGTSLPATCGQGEMFFLLSGPVGANVYACVATNTWAIEAGSANLPTLTGNGGAVLTTDGTTLQWAQHGGDISGAPGAVTVQGIRNRAVSSTAPTAGQALIWNATSGAWQPQTVTVAQGFITLQNNGTTVGIRGIENFIPGLGITNAVADTGTQLNIQEMLDFAIIPTRASDQAGGTLLCGSASGSGVTYTCAMSPTLTGYTTGMVLHWRPDVATTGGSTTLNIDTLGARPVKLADGVTNPAVADVVAGNLYDIWYDGANFRLRGSPVNVGVPSVTQPACASALRGRIWQTFGASGVKDTVSVCAKDATDAFAWRTIY
jgi:hypothetical protein